MQFWKISTKAVPLWAWADFRTSTSCFDTSIARATKRAPAPSANAQGLVGWSTEPKGVEGERYSSRPQDKSRWVGSVITGYTFANPDHKKSARQAKLIIAEWFEKDLLEEVAYRSEGQRKDRMGVQATGRVGEQDI